MASTVLYLSQTQANRITELKEEEGKDDEDEDDMEDDLNMEFKIPNSLELSQKQLQDLKPPRRQ